MRCLDFDFIHILSLR